MPTSRDKQPGRNPVSSITITVVGTCAPQGSKRHVGNGVMIESSKKVKPWRQDVKHAALDAKIKSSQDTMTGDVRVYATFWLARPKGHYRTGRNSHLLRESAPLRPCFRPDLDKIIRSTMDALGEAGVFGDDAQISDIQASKRYATPQHLPGASITVESVPNVAALAVAS